MFELHHLTALEQLDWLRRGEVTPRELTDHYLARIERLDPELGAFATVTPERARERADAVAELPKAVALWGLPTADKDLVARAGVPTGLGSRLFAGEIAEESDELALVLDEAGAVSLGKTATPEFGLPSYTEPLAGRPARNPYDPSLGAGGSSGGAAVAVAAGLLPFAPGSDGGGSIRIPAAATGLVGLKPSRGRIPAGSGFLGLAGLAVPGPLARTVADAALLLDALVDGGAYEFATEAPRWDGGRVPERRRPWRGPLPARRHDELAVGDRLRARARPRGAGRARARAARARRPRSRPRGVPAGAGGRLRGGVPHDLAGRVPRRFRSRTTPSSWSSRSRAGSSSAGAELSARELADALAWLTGFERRIIRAFAPYDAVLTPALALTPRPVGWYDADDGERNFEQQVQYTPFTSFVNVSGLPAIALPVLQTESGLPMGVQLVGRPGGEHVLLAIGAQLERRLRWQRRHPSVW